jgi:hypothetical protein
MPNTLYVNDNQEKNNVTTLPIPANVFNPEDVKVELAKSGLDGLNFDYGSFPSISLQGKSFVFSDDADFELKSFDIQIMQTKKKYILVDAKDPDYPDVKYSHDGIVTVDGEPIDLLMEQMEAENRKPVLKRYLDILCQLNIEGKHNNKLAVLSISPTSVSRASGFFLQLQLQGLISKLNELTVTVSRGTQRTSKGGQVYHLWAFDVKQGVQAVA